MSGLNGCQRISSNAISTENMGLYGAFLDKFPNSVTVTCRDGSIDVKGSEVRCEKNLIFWVFLCFASVWNFTNFPRIIFAGNYLRWFLGDFGEPEIVYKIESPVWVSGFDNQVVVSILKQGSKTVDWMSRENWDE